MYKIIPWRLLSQLRLVSSPVRNVEKNLNEICVVLEILPSFKDSLYVTAIYIHGIQKKKMINVLCKQRLFMYVTE